MPAGEEEAAGASTATRPRPHGVPKPARAVARGRRVVRRRATSRCTWGRGTVPAGGEGAPRVPRRRIWRSFAHGSRTAGYRVTDTVQLEGFHRVYVRDPFGNRVELIEAGVSDRLVGSRAFHHVQLAMPPGEEADGRGSSTRGPGVRARPQARRTWRPAAVAGSARAPTELHLGSSSVSRLGEGASGAARPRAWRALRERR